MTFGLPEYFQKSKRLRDDTSITMDMILDDELTDQEFRVLCFLRMCRKRHDRVVPELEERFSLSVAELDQLWEHLYELGYMIDQKD